MTDDEIIAAMRAGDRRAGNLLARRYYRKLNAYYRKRMSTEEAAEYTQATLTETVGRIDRFRGDSTFHHYVFSIVRRVMADRHRRAARRIVTEPAPSSEPIADDTSPGTRLARTELLEQVVEIVETLDEHYRSVLQLKLQGANNFEIAEALDVRYNTVRSRLSRGISMVRDRLGDAIDEFFGVEPPAPTKLVSPTP